MKMPDRHTIPITILICDDDRVERLRTQQAIENAHIVNDLRFVEDGAQVLDYLLRRGAYAGETGAAPRPGLILLDLELPRMGPETFARIQGDPTLADIPMLILTATQLDSDAMERHRLGASSFITKPLTFAGLVGAMHGLDRFWFELLESSPATAH